MAYYLFTKRGRHMATHLAVGRAQYIQTTCGLVIGNNTISMKQGIKIRIEGESLSPKRRYRPRRLVTPLSSLGVTCKVCLAFPPPPPWEHIPPDKQTPRGTRNRP